MESYFVLLMGALLTLQVIRVSETEAAKILFHFFMVLTIYEADMLLQSAQ